MRDALMQRQRAQKVVMLLGNVPALAVRAPAAAAAGTVGA
jgi:hypothetical protein